jgi:polysaccharide deacetylase family protein (PEP-CTERM system associated)
MFNILTIDVEDWYQSSTELFAGNDKDKIIYPSDKVVRNTSKLLEILSDNDTKATFFILGTVAEKFPDLIRRIKENGHEIATHGYSHYTVYKQSPTEFAMDLEKSISLIEEITKEKVIGYRAPYFSVTKDSRWALDIMIEQGLKYDSSIFPIGRKLYGIPDAPRYPYIIQNSSGSLVEFPISTYKLMKWNIPVGGGGYLRLLPYSLIKAGIIQTNKQDYPAVIYIHPYELDTDVELIPSHNNTLKDQWVRITQELNRASVDKKIRALVNEFEFSSIRSYFDQCDFAKFLCGD